MQREVYFTRSTKQKGDNARPLDTHTTQHPLQDVLQLLWAERSLAPIHH